MLVSGWQHHGALNSAGERRGERDSEVFEIFASGISGYPAWTTWWSAGDGRLVCGTSSERLEALRERASLAAC